MSQMRVLLAVVVAACACSGDPEPGPPQRLDRFVPRLPAVSHPAARVVSAPRPPPPPPAEPIPAVHGASITLLATVEDGSAAVTVDAQGSLRVWPSLDGTREPVVVQGPVPAELAITRAGDELAVAIVDEAGALTVIRLDPDGRTLGRAQLADEQAVTQLDATPQGFLAITADQAIELVSVRGARVARLPPAARILALAYRNGRALVLHPVGDHQVRGRWLELAGGAHWADETGELSLDPHTVSLRGAVLSPDHTRLALQGAGGRLVAVELASGTTSSLASACAPIGYVDDELVACTNRDGIAFVDRASKRAGFAGFDGSPGTATVAGHAVAFAHRLAIGLAERKAVHYLGYALVGAVSLHDSGLGLVLAGDRRFLVDDRAFTLAKRLSVRVPDEATLLDVMPLTATLQATLVTPDGDSVSRLSVGGRVVIDDVRDTAIHFEPKTRLLAQATGGATTFVRVEDDKLGAPNVLGTSESPLAEYFVDSSEPIDQVFLTDPELAAGRIAFVVHDRRVLELRAEDLAPKARAVKSHSVSAPVAAIDRAGHVYLHRDRRDVALDGGAVTFAGTAEATRVVPSPDGTLVAIEGATLSLFASDGTLRWRQPTRGLAVTWTRDGRLLGLSGGIAELELATGEPRARRCGWSFGLYAHALDGMNGIPMACDL